MIPRWTISSGLREPLVSTENLKYCGLSSTWVRGGLGLGLGLLGLGLGLGVGLEP